MTMATDDLLTRAVEHTVRLWQRTQTTHWVPPLPGMHRCEVGTCTVRALPVRVFRRLNQHADVPMYLRGNYIRHSNNTMVHVCSPAFCPGPTVLPDEHWIALARETALFICAQSGVMHRCDDACTYAEIDDTSAERVCRLTGLVRGAIFRDKYWNPNRNQQLKSERMFSVFTRDGGRIVVGGTTASDRLANTLNQIFLATDNATLLSLISTRRPAKQSLREAYFVTAVGKIAMLFSQQRIREADDAKRRLVQRHIASLANYVQERRDRVVYMTAARRASANLKRAQQQSLVRALPDEIRRQLVLEWAQRCVRFWYIMRTRTELGRETPQAISFYEFIDAAIHLFAEGIAVPPRGNSGSGVEYVIVPDMLFHAYAVYDQAIDASARPNATPGDKITETKTRIKRAIVNAVLVEHVAVERLRLDSVTFDECLEKNFISFSCTRGTPSTHYK